MFLSNLSSRPLLSNIIFIKSELPGLIGYLGNSGTVHPQAGTQFEIIKSPFPVLVNLNA